MSTLYSRFRSLRPLLPAVIALFLAACASVQSPRERIAWSGSEQLVVVVTRDWNAPSGELRRFLKKRTGRRPMVLPVVMEI